MAGSLPFPPPLQHGDAVGIVSPSAPAAGLFPNRFRRGVRQVEALGFRPVLGEHCTVVRGNVAGTPEERAADINGFFENPEVRAVIATIGGANSAELLPFLDWEVIRDNPKAFIGYSDITVLLLAIMRHAGFVSYYGPTLMTEFAEYPEMPDDSRAAFLTAMRETSLAISPFSTALVDRIDWASPEEQTTPRSRGPAPLPIVATAGRAEGVVVGGCVETIDHTRRTEVWPDFEDAIILLETSSDEPNLPYLSEAFNRFAELRMWDMASAIVFGRKQWPLEERQEVGNLLAELSGGRAPVLVGLDFGHISPIATIPLGAWAELDTTNNTLAISDSSARAADV